MQEDKFVVEDSNWPILLVRYPPVVTEQGIRDYAVACEKQFRRAREEKVKLAAVVDVRRADFRASAKLRALLAQELERVEATFPNVMTCDAIVADSAILRALVTAHFYFRPAARRRLFRAFDNPIKALAWAKECLAAALPS